MSICDLCGDDVDNCICPRCFKRYQDVIAAKRYPPQYIREGLEPTYPEWRYICLIGKRAADRPDATPESIKKATNDTVELCISNRKRRQTEAAKTAEQRRAEQEKKMNEYYPY